MKKSFLPMSVFRGLQTTDCKLNTLNLEMLLVRMLIIASMLFCGAGALCQRYPFINYTPVDGLVSNRVKSMFQDSKGKLYFLTSSGLSVYDGARFTNYTPADGLAQEFVNDIIEITPDSFWIATNINKLNCLVH